MPLIDLKYKFFGGQFYEVCLSCNILQGQRIA